MTYSFKENVCKEFVLQVHNTPFDKLDIPLIIEGMKKELQKTIVEYVNAKVKGK